MVNLFSNYSVISLEKVTSLLLIFFIWESEKFRICVLDSMSFIYQLKEEVF